MAENGRLVGIALFFVVLGAGLWWFLGGDEAEAPVIPAKTSEVVAGEISEEPLFEDDEPGGEAAAREDDGLLRSETGRVNA